MLSFTSPVVSGPNPAVAGFWYRYMVEMTSASPRPLVYAHLGNLHTTDTKARNYLDFLAMLAQLEVVAAGQLDFIYLPGDVADNGQLAQYRLAAAALRLASVPVYLIAGDHDMKPGSLANFYAVPAATPRPKAQMVQGVRCLFLDVCGPGTGGPDFRLGVAQLAWLGQERAQVPAGTEIAVFLHIYPAALRDAAARTQPGPAWALGRQRYNGHATRPQSQCPTPIS